MGYVRIYCRTGPIVCNRLTVWQPDQRDVRVDVFHYRSLLHCYWEYDCIRDLPDPDSFRSADELYDMYPLYVRTSISCDMDIIDYSQASS